jgi:hypothetical protein
VAVGDQEPARAVSRLPTFSAPANVGLGAEVKRGVTSGSAKWMKPSGQPDPDFVIRRWSKSRPQFDSETMISVGEATRSTYATWLPVRPHQATEPTAGVASVMEAIVVPQSRALPTPEAGRRFGMPLVVTRRYAT